MKVNFSGPMEKLNSDSGCCSTIAIRVFVSVSGYRHGSVNFGADDVVGAGDFGDVVEVGVGHTMGRGVWWWAAAPVFAPLP